MKNNQNNNNKNGKKENKKGRKSKDILDTDFIINNFDTLIEKMKKGNINTPKRIAHFLAQGCYETGGFKHFKENLNYKTPSNLMNVYGRKFKNKQHASEYLRNPRKLGNYVYGGRDGNNASEDGYKYSGKGFFHLTFKNNYKRYAKKLNVDIVNNPELVSDDPGINIDTGVLYWNDNNLNKYADKNDMEAICKKINGKKCKSISERTQTYNKIINSEIYKKIVKKMEESRLNYKNNSTNNNNNKSNNNNILNNNKNNIINETIGSNSENSTLNFTRNNFNVKIPNVYINKLGGVDFSNIDELIQNCKNISFKGLLDVKNLLLFNPKKNKNSDLYNNNNSIIINLEDVAVFLKILYDPSIKYKSISFSLDPYDPKNITGPYMRKVFYPDEIEKKQILQGTKVGEGMFLADYLLKQMSLGYTYDKKTKFPYPRDLLVQGLSPMKFSQEINGKINRIWIVTKEIESLSNSNGLYCINRIQLGVEARNMEVSKEGKLVDNKIQNINSPCYEFARKFTKLYDNISKHFKIFGRMKEIAGALAIAKYIYMNKYSINYDIVEKIYKSTLIPNYNIKVPAINHYNEKTFVDTIELDINEVARQTLEKLNLDINQKNIDLVKQKIIDEKINLKIGRTNRIVESVYGGVDLWSSLIKNEKNILDVSLSTVDNESFPDIITVENNQLNFDLSDCEVYDFPFLIKQKCIMCNNDLTLEELKSNEIFNFNNIFQSDNIQYCTNHIPFKCEICNQLIIDNLFSTIFQKYYHSKCLKCIHCYRKLGVIFSQCEEGFLHQECVEDYKYDEELKVLKDIYIHSPECEYCDDKIMGKCIDFNGYNLHEECVERIKNKRIDPSRYYLIEGILPKCYICKEYIFDNCLNTNIGKTHQECLGFIMFVIHKIYEAMNG